MSTMWLGVPGHKGTENQAMRVSQRWLFVVIVIAALVALVVVVTNRATQSDQTTNTVTLSFTCTPNNDDGYTLAVTNNNPESVSVAQVTVSFYNSNGVIQGQDTTDGMIIPAGQTYDYQGYYSQTSLGGVPATCDETQWTQQ
jgi:hypothetical protein